MTRGFCYPEMRRRRSRISTYSMLLMFNFYIKLVSLFVTGKELKKAAEVSRRASYYTVFFKLSLTLDIILQKCFSTTVLTNYALPNIFVTIQ